MKKTININVGGFAFIIEEEAYDRLHQYLHAVRRNLGTDVDTEEVMNDIELRIAELFREALKENGREVVDVALVEKVKGVMGKPEDYGDGTEHREKEASFTHTADYEESQRTLFRDPDNKMLGGVAAGLANYFGWDPLAFRIIFVLLLFGFGFGVLVYIVLWILIPEARSTADRLRMRGQPVNVDTIKKRFNDFKGDIERLGSPENQRKLRNQGNSFGSRIESLFRDFGRVVQRVLGLGLLLCGIFLLVFLLRYLSTGAVSIPQTAAEELFMQHHDLFFDAQLDYYALTGGMCLLVGLMVYGLLASGLDLLFQVRISSKPLKYAGVILAIVAVTSIFYGGINMGKHYTHDKAIVNRYELPMTDSTVQVEVPADPYFGNKVSSAGTSDDELIQVNPDRIVFGYPGLRIRMTDAETPYVEVEKMASGQREIKAIENSEAIEYNVQTDTGKVVLPPVFSTTVGHRFRGQRVKITLYVPENTIVHNTGNMKRIFYDSDISHRENGDAPFYRMTKKGLQRLK